MSTRIRLDDLTSDQLDELYATNQRLNRRAQRLESELAAYRRAVTQWEISERGTYIPHSSLRAIGKASGVDILGSVRHLKHFQRAEQAEAAIARVRNLHHQDGDHCAICTTDFGRLNAPWPCDTIRALDQPAHNAGPSVAECAQADRNWDVQKAGE
ncbi:hypothetical protein [Streptomyces sp. NPDC006355]|uniref:hypothetical protein n=1 Tax=Streptomyces sp. NPDC006355 TaxID=3156758 RepID=UPI0033A49838